MKANYLVVYYTHSANTRKVAAVINEKIDGTLFQLEPEEAYPAGYDDVVKQAKKEINAGFRPELKEDIDVSDYDVIFVGTPNWWSTMAPPVATFLEKHDFSGKKVAPFCTHGGGGMAHVQKDMEKLCKGAEVLKGFDVYGSGGSGIEDAVSKWIDRIL